MKVTVFGAYGRLGAPRDVPHRQGRKVVEVQADSEAVDPTKIIDACTPPTAPKC